MVKNEEGASASLCIRLVAGTAGLGDDALELVDLLLGAAEGTELREKGQ